MDFYEFTIKRNENHFDLFVGSEYYGSYKTVLEAADTVEKLMRENKNEEKNQNGSKI